MSTQYNAIVAPYDYIRARTIAHIERENIASTLAPYIPNAAVLELACGSGFYTPSFFSWGARSVTAVDISSAMLAENRRRFGAWVTAQMGEQESIAAAPSVEFVDADATKVQRYPGGPFDLVFGAWLLNYAPDREGLVEMFRNVKLNLREGGRFVGITTVPSDDPVRDMEREMEVRPPPVGAGLLYSRFEDVKDGVYFNCHADTPLGPVDFDNYHLKADVYREAAKDAGMEGVEIWKGTWVPEKYLRGEGAGEAGMEELRSYQHVPNYGVIVVKK